eukprot:scaffold30278_cov146-Isochrysis_galbana.AAC.1
MARGAAKRLHACLSVRGWSVSQPGGSSPAKGGGGQCSRQKRFQIFWKGPFECNELLQGGRFEPPKRNVVDSRSC